MFDSNGDMTPHGECATAIAFASPYTYRLPVFAVSHDGGFQPLFDEG